MATAKIRLKIGSVEIDYEGDSAFLDKDLLKLVQDLQKIAPAVAAVPPHVNPNPAAGKPAGGSGGPPSLTTKSIASTIGAKSGSELAEAAAAHLAIINGMASFKRTELNEAMKSATGVYNKNMTANLSKIIQTLLNQKTLTETGKDTYSLKPEAEAKLKGQLNIG